MLKSFRIAALSTSLAVFGLALSEMPTSPVASDAWAQAKTLDELLAKVREGYSRDRAEDRARLDRFRSARNQQQALLNQAKADVAREEAESQRLEGIFNENDLALGELELELAERLGAFGELFGVARQVAGDTRGQLENSLISAQIRGRTGILNEIATNKELPTIQQLKEMWFILLQEAVEQGKVAKFEATVVDTDGEPSQQEVVRVGPFSAVADSLFLEFVPETEQLRFLGRQPGGTWLGAADDLQDADPGELVRTAIDPSSGAILGLLIQTPSFRERIDQGGLVGYTVMVLAALGLLIGILRLFALMGTAGAVRRQARNLGRPSKGNPLGRVLIAYEENQRADTETLELKLDEAILKEIPSLEAGLNTVKVLAGVAPLLGLLGTVTGMIITFQVITLFGTGDPKLMAGGISQALVTTVQGLVAAIPLLLIHSLASGRARVIQQTLEEQAAGLVAARAEGR